MFDIGDSSLDLTLDLLGILGTGDAALTLRPPRLPDTDSSILLGILPPQSGARPRLTGLESPEELPRLVSKTLVALPSAAAAAGQATPPKIEVVAEESDKPAMVDKTRVYG